MAIYYYYCNVYWFSFYFYSTLSVPEKAKSCAAENDFDIHAYSFGSFPEQLRPGRIVRVGLIQNKIVLPTSASIADQVSGSVSKI